ncbi:MAG: FAD-dependent oxidoreductase [Sphingobacteriaceae bacterium]|nr:MAG: FAD-dependent oxidoreductase [Sphingobacteriaceae bacterium]
MKKTDVLIIGAGAAGLMAASQLVKAGKKVTVLEARNHTGGRIHTLRNTLFFKNAELGAEFIHGNLPITLALLKDARIAYHTSAGEMWEYCDGSFKKSEQFAEGWDLLLKKLKQLKKDMPINDFVQQQFAEEKYAALRENVWNYVSGYDTADPRKASAFALRNEWLHEDENAQYRITNGYCSLIKYLAGISKSAGNEIILNAVVKEVLWKKGDVKVTTTDDVIYEAEKVIIALPLGVLQADKHEIGAISFHPAIPEQNTAINSMGFGAIIKVLLKFDKPFWEGKDIEGLAGQSLKNMGFLFTEEAIPTWWTQTPQHSALLTGWLGGPAANDKKDHSADEILMLVLISLSNVFKISTEELKAKLIAWHVANWTAEPYTRGSYAYDTIESPAARKVLVKPVENTLYFAGEYLYDGPAMGTVEAALTSGMKTAGKVLL